MPERFLVTAKFRFASINLDDATVWQPAKREADYLFDPNPVPAHPEIIIIYGDGRLSGSGGWVAIMEVDSPNPRQTLDTWLFGRAAPDAAGKPSSTGHLSQLFDYEIESLVGSQNVQDFVPASGLVLSPGHTW
jgi:hypothetical protein